MVTIGLNASHATSGNVRSTLKGHAKAGGSDADPGTVFANFRKQAEAIDATANDPTPKGTNSNDTHARRFAPAPPLWLSEEAEAIDDVEATAANSPAARSAAGKAADMSLYAKNDDIATMVDIPSHALPLLTDGWIDLSKVTNGLPLEQVAYQTATRS